MVSDEIILTAFKGTSSEKLIDTMQSYTTVILPNDRVRDSEIVCNMILDGVLKYVVCFGQKPVLKDKITIELSAKGMTGYIDTSFPWQWLKNIFEKNGVPVKVSHNAGTSFCNCLYYNCMEYIEEKALDTKVIFVHIPTSSNITEQEQFFQKINNVIMELMEG